MSPEPLAEWEGAPVEAWRAVWGVPRLLVFASLESTNDVARALADAGAPAGTTVIADVQTRGRGQHGRSWLTPPGKALLLSIVVRPEAPATGTSAPAVLPLRVGLAAARAIEQTSGVRVQLKWPNDLLIDGLKLAGILCEGAHGGAARPFVVVGIGINVAQAADELPPRLDPQATSLRLAAGEPPPRAALAGAVVRAVVACGEREPAPLSADELDDYAARDALRGRRILLDGAPGGTAVGLAPDGALLLRSGGRVTPVRAGSVRAAPTTGRDLSLTRSER